MKFKLENYNGKYVMHCKSEAEARTFCDFLHKAGRAWNNGETYAGFTEWSEFKEDTVYFFNEGLYGSFENVGSEYKILEWSDFEIGEAKNAN